MNPQDPQNTPNDNQSPQPPQQFAPQQPFQQPQSPFPAQPLPTAQNQPVYPQASSSSSKKTVLIVGGVLITLLILAGVGFSLLGNKDSTTTANQQQEAKTTTDADANKLTPQASNAQTAALAAVEGYVSLSKLCYTIQIPKENDAGEENNCVFNARFGADGLTSMTVINFIKYRESLDVNVAYLKADEAKLGSTVVSEEHMKIGGLDAKKIVFKGKGTAGTTTGHFLVATDKYKIDGVNVTGFDILASSYDKPANKTIIDNIISSWQWK